MSYFPFCVSVVNDKILSFSENISNFGGCTDSFSKDDIKETHHESAREESLLLSCSSLL